MASSKTLFDRFKNRLRHKGRQWRGILVSVDGHIEVPDRPYHYYVRLERSGGRGEPGIFPGTVARPFENLPVLIEEDPRDGRQVIIGVDRNTLAYSDQTDIPDPTLPRHGPTHNFGGDDMPFFLSQRQIYELRIQPGATDGHVSVLPGAYMLNGALYVSTLIIDVDLSTSQPASGTAWVMLSIDSSKTVSVSASETDPEDLSDASVGKYALGAVRVKSSTLEITWDDILPTQNRSSLPKDIVGLNSLGFDLTPTDVPTTVGTLSWDEDEETLTLALPNGVAGQLLQELFANVKNQTGASIADGTPVMFVGSLGASGRILIAKALADGTYLSAYFLGLVTETIDNGDDGKVTWYGKVRGIDTSGAPYSETWSDGDEIYVSQTTSGWLTNVRPTSGQVINVGAVVYASATVGTIFVRPSWYGRIQDLTDVTITSVADSELIQWNSATSTWVNVDPVDVVLPALGSVTKEPGGFEDQDNIVVSYDYTTRQITLTHTSGTITYYVDGVKYELTSPWVSDAHTATNGAWFLYDSGSGPVWSTTVWSFEYAQFAYVNYNSPSGAYLGLRETHGFMPYLTHRELHEQVGTYRRSGGSLTTGTYTLQPASPTDADNTPGFDAATIADEDLTTTVTVWTQGTYSLLYFSGSGTVVFNLTATLPFRVGTAYPIINEWDGSAFTDTETVNGRYFNVYQVLVPAASDTESQKYRVLIIQPQEAYSTLSGASAEDFREVYLGEFTNLSPEFVAYARITYRTSASYNSASGRSRIEAVSYLTGPRASQVVSSTVTPASHTVLSDRSEPDQHPASAITNTPAGTISSTDVQSAINELDSSRYTDEEAIDAVANAFLDTNTIAWTYYDPTDEIEADVVLKSGGGLADDSSGIYIEAFEEMIPEHVLEFTEQATLGVGANYFYLPRGHVYRSGLTPSRISEVLVDSVDKTSDQGTVWQEVPRDTTGLTWSNWPGNTMAGAESVYGDGTCELLTWGIYRYTTTSSEVWSITWQERRIVFNPLRVRECVMSNSTTLATGTAEWANQKRYSDTGFVETRNTNGVIISGIPDGYKVLIWGGPIKIRTRSRGRHWRPLTITGPASGDSHVAIYAGSVGNNRLIGASLYNPDTYAFSEVKTIGYVVNSSSLKLLRVLK